MIFSVGVSSSRGTERAVNQDSVHTQPLLESGLLAVIADGLGSYAASAEASARAATLVAAQISEASQRGIVDRRALRDAVQHANQMLWREALERAAALKTTLTALVCLPGTALLAHVGDCRAYLVRDAQVKTLTTDHSLSAELGFIRRFLPTSSGSRSSRHVLNRVLGEHPIVRIDLHTIDLRAGDRLLLCSDGVWASIDDTSLQMLATGGDDEQQLVERLIAEAQRRGGTDDGSAIMISVGAATKLGATWEHANRHDLAGHAVSVGLA